MSEDIKEITIENTGKNPITLSIPAARDIEKIQKELELLKIKFEANLRLVLFGTASLMILNVFIIAMLLQ